MLETQIKPKPGEGAGLWLLKIVSGGLILVILVIHFLVNHLLPAQGLLSHQEVVEYYRLWFIPVMEAFFLVFVVSHSLIGTRSILLDLNPSKTVLRGIDIVLWIIGIGSTAYGLWLIWAILQFNG